MKRVSILFTLLLISTTILFGQVPKEKREKMLNFFHEVRQRIATPELPRNSLATFLLQTTEFF